MVAFLVYHFVWGHSGVLQNLLPISQDTFLQLNINCKNYTCGLKWSGKTTVEVKKIAACQKKSLFWVFGPKDLLCVLLKNLPCHRSTFTGKIVWPYKCLIMYSTVKTIFSIYLFRKVRTHTLLFQVYEISRDLRGLVWTSWLYLSIIS